VTSQHAKDSDDIHSMQTESRKTKGLPAYLTQSSSDPASPATTPAAGLKPASTNYSGAQRTGPPAEASAQRRVNSRGLPGWMVGGPIQPQRAVTYYSSRFPLLEATNRSVAGQIARFAAITLCVTVIVGIILAARQRAADSALEAKLRTTELGMTIQEVASILGQPQSMNESGDSTRFCYDFHSWLLLPVLGVRLQAGQLSLTRDPRRSCFNFTRGILVGREP
jgi:hypothetical protein